MCSHSYKRLNDHNLQLYSCTYWKITYVTTLEALHHWPMFNFIVIQFFGGAACQSASFWWPWVFEKQDNKTRVFSAFNFVNETLKENLTDRLPQKIVIDVGEPEEDALYYVRPNLLPGQTLMISHVA